MKCADQVLAERMIDARLAADRAIYLSQQRRRHLNERYAAQVGGRDESCKVADDSSAERDDEYPTARHDARLRKYIAFRRCEDSCTARRRLSINACALKLSAL